MKKIVLAAAILLAGTLTAAAQRSPDQGGGLFSGQGRTKTTTTTTVAKPTPPPVRVFVPVPVPQTPVWNRSEHRYSQHNHRVCQEKSHRLHSYERHAAADGFLSPRERITIRTLKSDLDRTCGGHRWRG